MSNKILVVILGVVFSVLFSSGAYALIESGVPEMLTPQISLPDIEGSHEANAAIEELSVGLKTTTYADYLEEIQSEANDAAGGVSASNEASVASEAGEASEAADASAASAASE